MDLSAILSDEQCGDPIADLLLPMSDEDSWSPVVSTAPLRDEPISDDEHDHGPASSQDSDQFVAINDELSLRPAPNEHVAYADEFSPRPPPNQDEDQSPAEYANHEHDEQPPKPARSQGNDEAREFHTLLSPGTEVVLEPLERRPDTLAKVKEKHTCWLVLDDGMRSRASNKLVTVSITGRE